MSKTGAVVYAVRPDHLPGELVHQVVFFVGGAGRRQTGESFAAEFRLGGLDLVGDEAIGLVPGRFDELAVFSDQRGSQAVRVVNEIEPELALDAQQAVVGCTIERLNAYDLVALGQQVHLAADAAVGTGTSNNFLCLCHCRKIQ